MIIPRRLQVLIAAFSPILAGAHPILAQQSDTIRLGTLQSDAMKRDPRAREIDLLAAQSALRVRSIGAEQLPSLSINGQAQYQSTVASIPFALPGVTVPTPPLDTYDAHLGARQRIFDPALASRRNVEKAQLAESQARVRSALHALRQNVNDAYFAALKLQAERAELETVIADLTAQHRVATERVKAGAALQSEAKVLEAEILRRRQSVSDLEMNRDAALAVLSDLTGRELSTTAAIALPDLRDEVAQARASLSDLRDRPEYEQFALTREVLGRQRAAASARDLPRVSAFGRAGYGRPGLNPLASKFDTYWLAGVQVEWSPWTWGTTNRDREILTLQQQIVETEEAAFTESLRRSVVRDLASIDRLERTLEEDSVIIDLRDEVVRESRIRLAESVVTSAEYVDRQTDALAARVARSAHRVDLEQARARFLTSFGLEVR